MKRQAAPNASRRTPGRRSPEPDRNGRIVARLASMRLPFGRPDIDRYADRANLPEARGGPAVTFLGVASLLIDDGDSAFMTDGFFSRPGLLAVASGRISPDEQRITDGLRRAAPSGLAGIVSLHTTTTTCSTPRPSPRAPAQP